jgi:hypothetical protein
MKLVSNCINGTTTVQPLTQQTTRTTMRPFMQTPLLKTHHPMKRRFWNKKSNAMTINFETCIEVKKPVTKPKVIGAIKSVYDILGWSSPITVLSLPR